MCVCVRGATFSTLTLCCETDLFFVGCGAVLDLKARLGGDAAEVLLEESEGLRFVVHGRVMPLCQVLKGLAVVLC